MAPLPTMINVQTFMFALPAGTATMQVPVRTVEIDGAPWFVAKDVCRSLALRGYPSQHTAKLPHDEVMNVQVSHAQNMRLPELFAVKVPVVALVSEVVPVSRTVG